MRVGLNLPQYDIDFAAGAVDAVGAVRLGVDADQRGIDSLWVSDHPWVVAPDGRRHAALDPQVLLSALACRTERARLGTLVLAASMHPPKCLATTWTSMSALSPGRLTLGIGAGWYRPAHVSLGIPLETYPARMQRVEATLEALTAGDPGEGGPDWIGTPHRPALPFDVLVGGVGDEALEVAALRADIWNASWDVPPDSFRRRSADLDAVCRRLGRDPGSLRRSAGVTILCAETEAGVRDAVARLAARASWLADLEVAALRERALVGDPDGCAGHLARLGADEVVLSPAVRDDPELVRVICDELAPRLHETRRHPA